MKKIFIILSIFCLISSAKLNAQVPDTLVYLQNIIANKTQFIGHPFSKLFDSLNLNIQIKYFHPRRGAISNSNKEMYTAFAFYYPAIAEDVYLTYPCLEIHWQTPLNANQSFLLFNSNGGGQWNVSVYNYYKSVIIKDIGILE